jgi:hypothetical protein
MLIQNHLSTMATLLSVPSYENRYDAFVLWEDYALPFGQLRSQSGLCVNVRILGEYMPYATNRNKLGCGCFIIIFE